MDRRRHSLRSLGLVGTCIGALTLSLAGCTGSIEPPLSSAPDTPAKAGPADELPVTLCPGVVDPGETPVRPLTRAEYVQTILDISGVNVQSLNLLPPEGARGGFDRSADAFTFSSLQARGYLDVAEAVATKVVTTPALRTKVIGCDPTGALGVDCVRRFIPSFGRRAFRRPLTAEEAEALVALANNAAGDPDPYTAVRLVIHGVLQSPKFLLHSDVGVEDPSQVTRLRLTGYERAARLSYFLLGTAPDDALLTSAGQGGLDDAAKVEAAARQMLADPRARVQLRSFFGQWLGLPNLGTLNRDPKKFPLWNETLRTSMQEETLRLFDEYALSDGHDFSDILDARHTFLDASLAKVYGLPPPAANFARVDLTQTPRAGILTNPSLLTVTAGGDVTPIRRGRFIREVLFCRPPPEPPPGIPPLSAPKPGQTLRERLEEHRDNPVCAVCHDRLEPIGFGLARFDDIGVYRTADAAGKPIADDGTLLDAAEPAFNGPTELATKVREMGWFPSCAVDKVLEFGLARKADTEGGDRCGARRVEHALGTDIKDFRSIVLGIVTSDDFLFRRIPRATGDAP